MAISLQIVSLYIKTLPLAILTIQVVTNVKSFSCTTEIYTGAGSLKQLGKLQIRRLLLVTDPYFMENGEAQRLLGLSGSEATEIFHRVLPDPTVELAAEATAVLQAFDPDTVVALGGGSTLDLAKAMVYFAKAQLQLVAVPTTSGSGSEVTDFAILTHQGVKHPLVDPRLRPQVAILDSDLLTKLPRKLIADTGFDVLCHALEAYVAKNATAFTDSLARSAFGAAFSLLPASFAGNTGVRQRLHEASTMAGLAFNRGGLGLCHAMSHALGGAFHLPHGRLNAILLPAVLEQNSRAAGEKYAALARSAGIPGAADTVAVRNLTNALVRLRRELGLPQTLREAGVDPRQVWLATDRLVEATLADPCCATNPVTVADFTVKQILEAVTGHGG